MNKKIIIGIIITLVTAAATLGALYLLAPRDTPPAPEAQTVTSLSGDELYAQASDLYKSGKLQEAEETLTRAISAYKGSDLERREDRILEAEALLKLIKETQTLEDNLESAPPVIDTSD